MRNLALSRFEKRIREIISFNYDTEIPSVVYKLTDGSILKVFNAELLREMKPYYDLEKKVLAADKIHGLPEIILPAAAIYNDSTGLFTGYTMPGARGKSYTKYYDTLTDSQQLDLNRHAKVYSAIEKAIKKANMKDIVFPDLCTTENIFVNGNKVSFIDYDGLQIGSHISSSISSLLGDQKKILIPKYYDANSQLFKANLDKKSLIILYFITVFNIDLSHSIDLNNVNDSDFLQLFETLNLEDQDIQEKIWKAFQPTEDNEFLGDDVFKIAEKYKLTNSPDLPFKVLIKK